MINNFFNFKTKLLLIISLSFLWSLVLFLYWSYDYGLYYNQAINMSDNYKIYLNIFETKGPLYYVFINLISKIIGVGKIQSYISLSITTLLFFLSIYVIADSKTKKNFFLLFFFLISILHQQNVNISLVLFQFSIQIISFFLLLKFIESQNRNFFYVSAILYALSIFTKIDVIIYLPVYFLVIFFVKQRYKILLPLLLILTIFFIYFVLSFSLKFSLQEFIWNNYIFNSQFSYGYWGREPFLKIFNSPYHIYLIMFTGVGLLFFEIVDNFFFQKKINLQNFFKHKSLIVQILILFCGLFFWLYAGSDKNYHVFMIFLPLIFIITYNFNLLDRFSYKIIFFYLLTFFFFLITLYPDTKNVIVQKCWKKNVYCYEVQSYEEIVQEIRKYKKSQDIVILGSAGWPYLFSDTEINISLANYIMYADISKNGKITKFERPKPLISDHKKLMKKKPNYIFWISKELIDNYENTENLIPSTYLDELIEKSEQISLQGKFYKYKIIK